MTEIDKGIAVIIFHQGSDEQLQKCIAGLECAVTEQVEDVVSCETVSEVAKLAEEYRSAQQDVLLLDSAAILVENSISNLLRSRIDNSKAGMIAGYNVAMDKLEEAIAQGCTYESNTEERRVSLEMCAGILIRHEVLENITELAQHIISKKYLIRALSLSSLEAGYENLIQWQSFMVLQTNLQDGTIEEQIHDVEYVRQKWGIELSYYNSIRRDLMDMMEANSTNHIKVLEVGCGTGATLLHLGKRFPNAEIHGVEIDERAAHFASKMAQVSCGNIEDCNLDYPEEYFDYIILGDVVEHLVNPQKVLVYLKSILKKDGAILTSIPNVQHFSVVLPLLLGEFEYQDSGILDRTHLRFFTLATIQDMMKECGLDIQCVMPSYNHEMKESWIDQFLDRMCALSTAINKDGFEVWQYRLKLRKSGEEA